MKKLLLPLLAVLMLFSGCDIYDIGPEMVSDIIVAYSDSWQKDVDENVLYQDFAFPEITNDVMDRGMVSVSMLVTGVNGEDVYHQLPYVFPVENVDQRYYVSQNIRYEVRNGMVTIVMEWGDRVLYQAPRRDYVFKVNIVIPE